MTRRRIILIGVLGISAIAIAVAVAVLVQRKPPLQVQFGHVTTGAIAREVLTSGTLEPASVVDVGTQVSGTIQSLHADFNSIVTAGQVIARLDPSVHDARLAQARSEVIRADAAVQEMQIFATDAATKAERARTLAQQDLITRAELDTAEIAAKDTQAKAAAARAAAVAARAELRQAEINRSHTVIRSPIDGVVVSRNVEMGQTLAASVQSPVLFRIADLRRMHLMAEVGEAEVGGVQRGTQVSFEIESLGSEQFSGTIADVRLQPMQVAASGTAPGAANPAAGTAATTGNQPARSSSGSQTSGPQTTGSQTSPSPTSASGTSSATPAPTSSVGTTPAQQPASPVGQVISYTAIIDVDNPGNRIAPGSTAIVLLPTARRERVLRLPNRALGFRPSPDALRATGQAKLTLPRSDPGNDPTKGPEATVWKYERGSFVPITVRIGIADERWTEILAGSIQAGDSIVTEVRLGRN
jgi:HlyD family secretion protein